MSDERPVFQGSHLVKSMRSSGYRNTAYALAEIIDNSVEAKAKHIEVLYAEKQNYSAEPPVKQLDMIAIIDDGVGMTEDELWNSLIMGEGTRYEAKGIGKFGMGLPNSSMSQCRNVTVYSWKNQDEVLSVSMDLDEVGSSGLVIKKPKKAQIPDIWKKHSKYLKSAKTGTIVVWSKIDRHSWKRVNTLIRNFERIVGRIYRKFIHQNNLEIVLLTFDSETNKEDIDRKMLPNDPLYQMTPSSTPEPWDNKPMFKKDGDNLEDTIEVEGHSVIVRCTLATTEARKPQDGKSAGALPHGKHANFNLGISLIRANRELCVDTNLLQTYDPLERWWGVEVEFPNELDDVFGVTNNKQDANHFSSVTNEIGVIARNEQEDANLSDVSNDLHALVVRIYTRIRSMRRTIKATNKGLESKRSSDNPQELPLDPDPGPTITGKQENLSHEEKEQAITEALSKIYDPETASAEARHILDKKIKTVFKTDDLANPYFFDVGFKGGVTFITLNSEHRAYKHLIKALEKIPENTDEKTQQLLNKIRGAISLLFVSWANYENHTIDDAERDEIHNMRYNWSRKLTSLMKEWDE